MQIQQNLTSEEQHFVEGFINPVAFFDMNIRHVHHDVEIARDYQISVLLDDSKEVSTKAGRGVGKTTMLESDILHRMFTSPNHEGLLTTPNKAHIGPLWNRITSFVKADPFWDSFITRAVKSPEYTMEGANGYILHGRISGSSQGKGVLGLHVDDTWVDEAQLYMGMGLDQLQGCFKKHCRVRIFGVPNGMRMSYLSISQRDPNVSRHKITRFQDPNFTGAENERLIRIYGGRNSQAYLNQVLAEEGVATSKTFNPMYFTKCFVEMPGYDVFEFNGRKIKESEINEEDIAIPFIPKEAIQIDISADLGHDPDPSVIGIWYLTEHGHRFLACKIVLYSITYTRQVKLFDKLARIVGATNLSFDMGGPGQTVYLDLTNPDLYPDKPYNVIGVDFRTNVPIGATPTGDIIKENCKFYATTLIQNKFENKHIFLPEKDDILYNEVDGNTQYKTAKGNFVYVGDDHNLDMIRCMVLIDLLGKQFRPTSDGPLMGLTEF